MIEPLASPLMHIPANIAKLPKDLRGFPVPWNVAKGADGNYLFAANDGSKHMQALREHLCPICGERLDPILWFVGGPMSAFHQNGWYYDLPGHLDCVEFALQTCPYLAMPNYKHQTDLIKKVNEKLPENWKAKDESQDHNRPVVFVVVGSEKMETMNKSPGESLPIVRPIRPFLEVRYWKHGARLTAEDGAMLIAKSIIDQQT